MKKKWWILCVALLFLVFYVFSGKQNVTTYQIQETHLNLLAPCKEKVLICGIARNVEKAAQNTISSIESLGDQFLDYKVIIYENNSTDKTKEIFKCWEKKNPHVIFLSENLSVANFKRQSKMKIPHRIEKIARARNLVLNVVEDSRFSDYKYVIWADLDFLEPWSVEAIVETILHPEHDFDAVFANGSYDLFALRTKEFPIGFELVGDLFFQKIDQIRKKVSIDINDPWIPVYSAFGGMGIYKRDALLGCRYSAVVTQSLDSQVQQWLQAVNDPSEIVFYDDYQRMLAQNESIVAFSPLMFRDDQFPEIQGVLLPQGKTVWFSCTKNSTLPWTCEHVTFHASMAKKGNDRFYINPKIRTHWVQNGK